jgi:hypothetical protein
VNEALILSSLASYFDYERNCVFPRVHFYDWESDLLIVTGSRRIWEIEVKISRSDWLVDKVKAKFKNPFFSRISRFYYAVPQEVLDKGIPDFVDARTGILALELKNGVVYVRLVRKAGQLGKHQMSDKGMTRLYRSTYYRFWQTGKHHPQEVSKVDCRNMELLQSIANPASDD